jgi:hypothetical protein
VRLASETFLNSLESEFFNTLFTLKFLQLPELSAASDFHFSATACVCATRLGRLGEPFIHFFIYRGRAAA